MLFYSTLLLRVEMVDKSGSETMVLSPYEQSRVTAPSMLGNVFEKIVRVNDAIKKTIDGLINAQIFHIYGRILCSLRLCLCPSHILPALEMP